MAFNAAPEEVNLTKDENERLMAAMIAREEEIRKVMSLVIQKLPLKANMQIT